MTPDNNDHGTRKRPRAHGGPSRPAAALVALAMLAFAAPASAGTDVWDATVVVRSFNFNFIGFSDSVSGSSVSPGATFTVGSTNYTVIEIVTNPGDSNPYVDLKLSPHASVAATGNWTLHIGDRSIRFSNRNLRRGSTSWSWEDRNLWGRANTLFTDGASLSVRISTNAAPTVANEIPDQMAVAGTAFSYAFPTNTFSDADTSDTLVYSATKADDATLPAWLSFDPGTRTFSGTPTAAGTVSVKVKADDGDGGSVSDTFDITATPGPTPPTHCNLSDPNELWCANLVVGTFGTAYGFSTLNTYPGASLTPARFDYRGVTINVSNLVYSGTTLGLLIFRSSGTEPADGILGAGGLSLDLGTGGDKRSFAIDNPGLGDPLSLQFTNHGLSWSVGDVVPVTLLRDNTAPTLDNQIPDQTAVAGTAFSYAFPTNTFSDADTGDTLAYSATKADDATLPAWLSFDAGTRTFSGTPQAADAGTVSVKVTASDGNGGSVSDQFDIAVVPALTLSVSPAAIAEAAGTSTVTVGTGGATFTDDQTITLELSGTATKGDDYTIGAESLTLTAGQTSVTTTVTAVQDSIDDDAETVVITASNGASTIGSATVTITDDDDDLPGLTLSVTPATIYEDGTATVTIATSDNSPVTDAQTITLMLAGTATEGTDYTIASKTLTLAANTASVTTTITATTDSASEGDETVLVTATTGTTTIGSQQTVTIKDPPALTVSISLSASRLVEGGGPVTVPVVLSGAPGREVTIRVTVSPSRDASPSDYTVSSLSLTFGPAETRKEVTATATEDSEVDVGEAMRFSIDRDNLPAGITAPPGFSTIILVDNDFEYEASLVGGPALAVDEAGATLTATVRVQTPGRVVPENLAALNETVTLMVSTADGTATAGQDYTALTAQTLTFAPSNFMHIDFIPNDCDGDAECSRAEMTVSVPITDDTVYEGATPETFTLTLSHGSDQRVTYPSGASATVSITEDDAVPVLTLSVSPAAIAEAAGTSTVTVGTGGTTFTEDQTIALALSGTATKGDDYTIGAESLTLTAGETSVTTTVTAVQDSIDDDAETVIITASHDGGTIGTAQTITITDDDDDLPGLTLSVAPATIYEDGTATVTIATSDNSPVTDAQTITLTLAGTATEGTDYTIASKTLTLAANTASVTTTITATTDSASEGDETVLVTATTGTTTIGSQQTVTIKDPPALTVSHQFGSTKVLVEGDSLDAPVVLSGAPGREVTITVSALLFRGLSASDYTASPLSLTFGPEEVRKVVTVMAVDDSEADPGETLYLDLPQNADLPAGILGSTGSTSVPTTLK